ncbi:MAG: complex I subunit 5 family protein [Candidatus Acetothermia bacterium]
MLPLMLGVSSYVAAAIFSMVFPRHRFKFSLLGFAGALAGIYTAADIYFHSGTSLLTLGKWGNLGIELIIDETTLLFASLIVLLNLFTLLYVQDREQATFHSLYNLLFTASYSMAFSHDLFNIYVTIEFMSLVSILLIGYRRKNYQIYAGTKYLLVSALAMSLYLIGLAMVYRAGGHLAISQLVSSLEGASGYCAAWGLRLMFVGLAAKGGVFLFSMWLPDAHSYSGTVVSALLSAMAIKSGLIGIIRLSEFANWNFLLLTFGTLTGIAGAVFALLSQKPKRILAYSTFSQVGYVLLGVGIGSPIGFLAASLHIFFHGLFKGLLFLSVGHAGIGGIDIYDNKISLPWASKFGLFVGSLSILALPPFNGYFSKTLLLEEAHREWVWLAMLAIGVGTALYIIELDRVLLTPSQTGRAKKGDKAITFFGLTVVVSGIVTWLLLGTRETTALFIPHHATISFALLAGGGLIFLSLERELQNLQPPTLTFNLDNALMSLFTGVLLIELILFLI